MKKLHQTSCSFFLFPVQCSQAEIIAFVTLLHLEPYSFRVSHTIEQALFVCFALCFFPKPQTWSCQLTKVYQISTRFIHYLTVPETSNTPPYMWCLKVNVNLYAEAEQRKVRKGMMYSLILHNGIQCVICSIGFSKAWQPKGDKFFASN